MKTNNNGNYRVTHSNAEPSVYIVSRSPSPSPTQHAVLSDSGQHRHNLNIGTTKKLFKGSSPKEKEAKEALDREGKKI